MEGFTRLDHRLFQVLLAGSFTKRQLKILLLIIRFSVGYQKSYALLKKRDFSAAGVSPYCVTAELNKLVALGVIHWDLPREAFWLNRDIGQWQVEIPGENLGRLTRIGGKNSLKGQTDLYQNRQVQIAKKTTPSIDREIQLQKDQSFTELLKIYLSEVAPLTSLEATTLRQVMESYPPEAIKQAIKDLTTSKDRSFPHFLKALDGHTAAQRRSSLNRVGSRINSFWHRIHRP